MAALLSILSHLIRLRADWECITGQGKVFPIPGVEGKKS